MVAAPGRISAIVMPRASAIAAAILTAVFAGGVAPLAAQPPAAQPPAGEKRIALVIGNADYDQGRLRNPANDARAMAESLRRAGFEVIRAINADRRQMYEAIVDFGDRLKSARGVGLFYFAGHGLQVSGRNYMVPLGARITSERMVDPETIDVNQVLAEMDAAQGRVNIVILDACRDNPYARSFRSGARGLVQVDAPRGTLIAYATSPGKVAADGTEANSPYTAALVKHMAAPGLPIEGVFKRVRVEVLERTGNRQEPWEASSLTGDFVFVAGGAAAAPAVAAVPPAPELQVRERPAYGSLAVTSRVAGVEVWLGERRLGALREGATLEVDNVPAGPHRLRATREGYREWQREVRVEANRRAEAVIDIEALGPARILRGDDGAEMVLVPAGDFWMGSDQAEVTGVVEECKNSGGKEDACKAWYERELPRHRVVLDGFYLDRVEVSNALFERFVRATGHRTTAEERGSGESWEEKDGKWSFVDLKGATWRNPRDRGQPEPQHPVVQVSWHDAAAYCQWAGKRLPTEAEWEKAARGTDGRRYPWGQDWNPAWANGGMSVRATRPVGSYPAGASPYGALDMAGNLLEWTADWFGQDYYGKSPERNPTGPGSGLLRVLRGGSWGNHPLDLRTAYRGSNPPEFHHAIAGFRCARGLPSQPRKSG